jgi:hypothetical protein
VKTLASIGGAVLVVLILLYANGYFHSADRMKGRNQFHNTGQETSESLAKSQRLAQEKERLITAQEAERQRLAQEEAERQRLVQERTDSERQRLAQERLDSERQRVAKEAERLPKAQERIEAEPQRKIQEEDQRRIAKERIEAENQRKAQEEAEKKKRDDDFKQCLQAAEEAYSANWARTCRQIDSPPNCILPPLVVARFDGPRRDARDECARLYSVK